MEHKRDLDSNAGAVASLPMVDGSARTRYLSAEKAAAYLNVSVRFVRRAASARRLRHYRVGKFVRFDPTDLDAFVTVREPTGESDPVLASNVWRSGREVTR